jgi:D-glycero-alpha-D-manno-heptose 1-phosphate guanylyltransferase
MLEVIILAGGLGTRLQSVVKDVPKCMAPVAGHPFLFHLLNWLSSYDINRVILSVGHLREVIFEWVDTHKALFSFQIDYAIEQEPMGTGGGIRQAMKQVKAAQVLIVNGDTFFNINLNEFQTEHQANEAVLSMALKPMHHFDRYGNVIVNHNLVIGFQEKHYCDSGLINGGLYILNSANSFFNTLPEKCSFEKDVLEPNSITGLIHGFPHDNYFIDIGIPEDYSKANLDFMNGTQKTEIL